MSFGTIVKKKNISGYRLSKESGVPQTTVADLMSGKASLLKCNAETLYRLSQVLGVSMEEMVAGEMKSKMKKDPFDAFRKVELRRLKNLDDVPYLIQILEGGRIPRLRKLHQDAQAYYLVALVDYLSRIHEVPRCKDFDDIRQEKLSEAIYPGLGNLVKSPVMKKKKEDTAIPEFKHFNIMENDIRSAS